MKSGILVDAEWMLRDARSRTKLQEGLGKAPMLMLSMCVKLPKCSALQRGLKRSRDESLALDIYSIKSWGRCGVFDPGESSTYRNRSCRHPN